jgi:hypothetical protein
MRAIDYYKHLNADDKVKFSIPETAKQVEDLNYGMQRFLCEVVKNREASDNMKYTRFKQHTQQLRELLEAGWY